MIAVFVEKHEALRLEVGGGNVYECQDVRKISMVLMFFAGKST